MARLVAVGILSDKTGDVVVLLAGSFGEGEEGVEAIGESLLTAG